MQFGLAAPLVVCQARWIHLVKELTERECYPPFETARETHKKLGEVDVIIRRLNERTVDRVSYSYSAYDLQ